MALTLMQKLRRSSFAKKFDQAMNRKVADQTAAVPEDVKEGHVAVFAIDGKKSMRFIVDLSCLSNPAFLELLEKAEEEFGLQQEGVLAVPCKHEDFRRITCILS